MAHDTHFLSRLERVSLPHVELAMSLYNDTPLLQFILGKVNLPESADRVAISLDDPEKGPFLVVMRNGHFVTCLGEGMLVRELPVITRSQLDTLAEHVTDLRARLTVAQSLIGKAGNVNKLLRRIFTAGAELSREEFIGISAWQPLMRMQFLGYALDSASFLSQMRVRLRKVKARPKPHEVPLLRDYWNNVWAIGHLLLLFAMNARETLEENAELARHLRSMQISWPAVRQGLVPVSIRGAWAAGKLGKMVLGGYKDCLEPPSSPLSVTNAVYGLTALAVRHRGLRGEIRKVFHAEHTFPNGPDGNMSAAILKLAATSFEVSFDHREEMREFHRRAGGGLFIRQWNRFNPESPPRYTSPDEVPENLALAAVANAMGIDLITSDSILHVLVTLPWTASAQPEDLYYPTETVKEVGLPFIPELVVKLLDAHRAYEGKSRPARAETVLGRNELCSCGSGKKYKRCCALRSASEAQDSDKLPAEPVLRQEL